MTDLNNNNIKSAIPFHIAIVGNIGAGKSELSKRINSELNRTSELKVKLIKERVDEWTELGILDWMYKDPKTFAFPFQVMAMSSRMREYALALKENTEIIISDGHIYADRKMFTDNFIKCGLITDKHAAIYDYTFSNWDNIYSSIIPDVWIKIDISPEVCLKRIKNRGRTEERNITLDYLTNLEESLERNIDSITKGKPIIRLRVADNEIIESDRVKIFDFIKNKST